MNTLTVDGAEAWRAWLAEHHGREKLVWLVFFKKHTGKTAVSYQDAVEEALCWGWIDSVKKRLDDDRYAFKFTPRKEQSFWSASNKRRVAKLERQGRLEAPGRALIEAAKKNGWWDKRPAAERPAPMPDELAAALRAHPAAQAGYDGLTAAQQRQYRLWVGSAKRPATRARRAEEARGKLERGEKLGMK